MFPGHVPESNSLVLQTIRNLRAHVALNCEASSLLPYTKYLEDHGWSLCFNDAQDLCCLACLGLTGSIGQIAGPYESNQADI